MEEEDPAAVKHTTAFKTHMLRIKTLKPIKSLQIPTTFKVITLTMRELLKLMSWEELDKEPEFFF